MKKSTKIFANNKGYLLLTIVTSLIQAVASVVMAIASRDLLDSAKEDIFINGLKLVVLVLIMILAYCLNHLFQQKLQLKLECNLKKELYSEIFKKDYYTISKIHSGNLMNYLTSDINVVSQNAATIIPSLLLFVTKLVLAFALLAYLLPELALILLGIGLLAFLSSYAFRKKLKKLHKNVQEKDGIMRSYMQESIESMLVIKSFNGEEASFNKMNNYQDEYKIAKNKRINFSVSINTLLSLAFQCTYVITLIWCILKVHSGMSYGTLLAVVQLVGQIQGPMTNLSGFLPKYYQMKASEERINDIINLKSEEYLNSDAIFDFEKIEINNLSFSYDGFKVIESSNLTINKGDFILIKGLSGIGKSTLLKLLLGIYKPVIGDMIVEYNDEKINISKQTRSLFSYVPQGNFIFSGTIRENLTFFSPNIKEEEIIEALKIACADEFVKKLDNGLDSYIGEKGLGLSEGQIQRLAFARAILTSRKIILLDEATSALDQKTEIELLKNLKALNEVTCIIVTHKDASKEICNKEFVFDKTKIIERDL